MLRTVLSTCFTEIKQVYFTEVSKLVIILTYGTYSLVPCLSGRAEMGGGSSINYSYLLESQEGSQKRGF